MIVDACGLRFVWNIISAAFWPPASAPSLLFPCVQVCSEPVACTDVVLSPSLMDKASAHNPKDLGSIPTGVTSWFSHDGDWFEDVRVTNLREKGVHGKRCISESHESKPFILLLDACSPAP